MSGNEMSASPILNNDEKIVNNQEQNHIGIQNQPSHLQGLTEEQISLLSESKLKTLFDQCDSATWNLFLLELKMSHSKNQWKKIRNRLGRKLHIKKKKKEIKSMRNQKNNNSDSKSNDNETNQHTLHKDENNEFKEKNISKKSERRRDIQTNHLILRTEMMRSNSWDERFCLAIDCAFHDKMTTMELRSLASQLGHVYSSNSKILNPWYMVFSGINGALSEVMKGMRFAFQSWSVDVSELSLLESLWYTQQKFIYRQSHPYDSTMILSSKIQTEEQSDFEKEKILKSYLDELQKLENENIPLSNFSTIQDSLEWNQLKERVVYLTADSPNQLQALEKGTIYIIGGIVDRNRHKGLCLDRANSLGVKHAKFPIDEILGSDLMASTVITVNQCFELMKEFQDQGSWEKSLDAVFPLRKRKQRENDENFSKRKRDDP